jgi:hypothetical protein
MSTNCRLVQSVPSPAITIYHYYYHVTSVRPGRYTSGRTVWPASLQNIGDEGWNKLIGAVARVHYHNMHQVRAWSNIARQMSQAVAFAIAQAPLNTSARGYWVESRDAVASLAYDLLLKGGVDIPGLGFLQCSTCQEYHATNHDIEVGCAPLRKQFEMEQAEGDILLAKLRAVEENLANANKTIRKNRITIAGSKKALSENQTKLNAVHVNLSRVNSELLSVRAEAVSLHEEVANLKVDLKDRPMAEPTASSESLDHSNIMDTLQQLMSKVATMEKSSSLAFLRIENRIGEGMRASRGGDVPPSKATPVSVTVPREAPRTQGTSASTAAGVAQSQHAPTTPARPKPVPSSAAQSKTPAPAEASPPPTPTKPTFAQAASRGNGGGGAWQEATKKKKFKPAPGPQTTTQASSAPASQPSKPVNPKDAKYTTMVVCFIGNPPPPDMIPSLYDVMRHLRTMFLQDAKAKEASLDLIAGVERKTTGNITLTWPKVVKFADVLKYEVEILCALTGDNYKAVLQTNEHWTKMVVSGVITHNSDGEPFTTEEIMTQLRNNFGFGELQYVWPARWLVSLGAPLPARSSFTAGIVDGNQKMQKHLDANSIPIFIFGSQAHVRAFKERAKRAQCHNCWKDGHMRMKCTQRRPTCHLCSEPHTEREHYTKCSCEKGNNCQCPYKCAACQGDHPADDPACPLWKNYRPVRKQAEPTRAATESEYGDVGDKTLVDEAPDVPMREPTAADARIDDLISQFTTPGPSVPA